MKRPAKCACVGLGLGVVWAALQFVVLEAVDRTFHGHTVQPARFAYQLYEILNAPAGLISHIWCDVLRFPPHSEAAWVVVPVASAMVQWGLIGLLGGIWWGSRHKNSRG